MATLVSLQLEVNNLQAQLTTLRTQFLVMQGKLTALQQQQSRDETTINQLKTKLDTVKRG